MKWHWFGIWAGDVGKWKWYLLIHIHKISDKKLWSEFSIKNLNINCLVTEAALSSWRRQLQVSYWGLWATTNEVGHGQSSSRPNCRHRVGEPKKPEKEPWKKCFFFFNLQKKYKMATNFTTSKEPKKEKLQFRPALIFVTIEILRSKS